MTGYARANGSNTAASWSWDIKSVNGRNLETRFRLPATLEFIEIPLKKILAERFSRGSFFAALSLHASDTANQFSLNEAALASIVDAIGRIEARVTCAPPRADAILAIKGVLNARDLAEDDAEREALAVDLCASFREAAALLEISRRDEGLALREVLEAHLREIERLVADARSAAGAQPLAIRKRIAAQIEDLLSGKMDSDRIDQEAALMALRADIREELDRLSAHSEAARTLLDQEGALGRKLDFLSQEFNREANTLASKAADMEIKRIGLDLKSVIDQFREQVQNIE